MLYFIIGILAGSIVGLAIHCVRIHVLNKHSYCITQGKDCVTDAISIENMVYNRLLSCSYALHREQYENYREYGKYSYVFDIGGEPEGMDGYDEILKHEDNGHLWLSYFCYMINNAGYKIVLLEK